MMMTMTDFGSHFAGSTSSDTMSDSVGSRQPRVRTIRLVRPITGTLPPPGLTCRHGPGLGFSLRGGREHGTGFFVSSVEPGSEAHRQGLKVGDQIIRVNGFTVEDAVHKEVLQLISNHTHLTLKVRSVGMIPVKDKITDPLSWQIISDYGSARSSPPLSDKPHDVRISIMVAPRSKLGCGICKGPDWKPGIFVQFTKDGGIAREAGLRPGDQILFCNNVDFNDIAFNEAVNLMKTARQLDLIVRKSAGSELFPGESSGYNSSASSVTGDQSPSWSDSKRLSIVKEENLDLEDRLSQLDMRLKSKKWEKIQWDDDNRRHYKPTIINLSENGTTIKNNGTESDCAIDDVVDGNKSGNSNNVCLINHQHEMKTVVVDVHRSDVEDNDKNENVSGRKSPSTSSFVSLASRSSTASSSLTSAISQELQRRSERKVEQKPSIDEQLEKKKMIPNGVDSEKQSQHNKLMDEFKIAHRKMFKSLSNSSSDETASVTAEENKPQAAKEVLNNDRDANSRQRVPIMDDRQQNPLPPKETLQERSVLSRGSLSAPPPPPPPMPKGENKTSGPNGLNVKIPSPPNPPKAPTTSITTKSKAPPVPVKVYSQLPPPCPTPDYDTMSISSSTCSTLPRNINPPNTSTFRPNNINNKINNGLNSNNINNNNNKKKTTSQSISDTVEMESLESFKLNNPSSPRPKPPNTYFKTKQSVSPQSSNGSTSSGSTSSSATMMRRQQKHVSVTIGEYPSGSNRKEPGKFDFLQGSGSDEADRCNVGESSVSSKFVSELASTLQRSNLRKRTESMENILNGQQISPHTNGSVTISVNKNLAKSTNDLSSKKVNDKLEQMLGNRVTINVPPSSDVRKNGILKNGNGNNSDFCMDHRPVVHQKSITFGEITTVINDRPLHVN